MQPRLRMGMACSGLLLIAILLSGCPTTGVRPTVPPSADAGAADRLAREGKPREAAQIYERLAAQASGAAQIDYYLKAAREWLAAGANTEAQRALSLVPITISGEQAITRALLSAQLALAQNNPQRALQLLRSVEPPPDSATAVTMLALKARAQFALGDATGGVRTLIDRERWLQGNAALDENRRLIVAGLRSAAADGASLTPPAGADPLLAGWLEFGAALRELDRNPFAAAAAVREWRSRYPLHPANGPILDALLRDSAIALDYPAQVALVLPLSGRQEGAGVAVRDGFLSAYYQQDMAQRPRIRIYDVANADVSSTVLRALDEGAQFIVGPLTKDEVSAAAGIADGRAPVLALNFLPADTSTPPQFFQFALSPEDEARQVARRVVSDGHPRGVALVPTGEWGTRVLTAFSDELVLLNGQLIAHGTYSSTQSDYTSVIQQVLRLSESRERYARLSSTLGVKLEFEPRRRGDIGFIFLAAQPAASRLIRPQLRFHYAGDLPTYSTSEAFEPDPAANVDLEGLIFPDMPWMIANDPVSQALRDSVRSAWPTRANRRGRLYAFGFDAYRLIPTLRNRQPGSVSVLSGMTGDLAVDADGRIRRELDWAKIHDGRPQMLALGTPPPIDSSN